MKRLSCLFLTLICCAAAAADDYEIRLHRPRKEGDKYKLSAAGKLFEESSRQAPGFAPRSSLNNFSVQMDAVVTVLAASTNGKPTRQSMVIEKLTRTEAGATKVMATNGTTVVAYYLDGKRTFEINGQAANAELARSLSVVADLESAGATDDELFGTSERKKVGDTWSVNAERMIEQLRRDSPLPITNVTGTVTLKEVVQEAGGPVLVVAIEARALVNPTSAPHIASEKISINFKAAGRIPVNVALGRPEDTAETAISMQARQRSRPDGPEAEMKGDLRTSVTFKRTLIR